MLIIFAGAHEKVKRAHYETFWYTHHTFVAWFFFLYFHGPVFWLWALPTLVPYMLDRAVRICYRGRCGRLRPGARERAPGGKGGGEGWRAVRGAEDGEGRAGQQGPEA
eukprot:6944562-Prymnesium_polylepis.1